MSRKIYKNQFCPSQLTRGFEIRISQIKHVPVFFLDLLNTLNQISDPH